MLVTGTRIGHYEILSAIGAGGMGEVYLAQDVRLNRRVALKVLPAALALDEAARKRLLNEARAVATLEHTNICTLYDVGEADGHSFIAMQYVEGETLAARLKRAPIDLPTAVSLCRQVAEALAEAHRLGIIHRDIKPQNIMVSRLNQAKVLDFGLAKAIARLHPDVDTASALTAQGVVSGTMQYMSPEQLRGEAVDERSDVFSLGIVMYEALTRVHPFARESWAETMSAVLTSDPACADVAWPADLRRIVRKSLEKDRERRYQTMRDLAIDLENLAREISAPVVAAAPDGDPRRSHRIGRLLPWMGAAAVIALVVVGVRSLLLVSSSPVTSSAGDYQQITDFTDTVSAPSLSPDGQMVTFLLGADPSSFTRPSDPSFLNRNGQIYVKRLPNGDAVRLTNDPRPKFGPVFTPDGSRVAYSTAMSPEGWITWTVPISGGEPTRLLPNAAGLTWIDARRVMFSEIESGSTIHMGLVTSTQDRAEARTIYLPTHVRGMAHYSYISPDRAWVLVVEMGPTGAWQPCRLVPFDGSSPGRTVGPDGACRSAGWSPDGKWMYFTAAVGAVSHLWRQRFPDGVPAAMTSGSATEEEGVAVAPDGRSIVTALGRRRSALWLHDEKGERVLSSEGFALAPSLSRNGTRLYFLLRRAATFATVELSVLDLASGKTERLLPDYSIRDYDVSPDEKEVAFTTTGGNGDLQIWLARLDRSSAPRLMVSGGDTVAFGADGDLLFRSVEGHANYVSRVTRDGKAPTRVWTAPITTMLSVSPDGRWVATTTAAGNEGYSSGVIAVPTDGGTPRRICPALCRVDWSPDGRWLHLGLVTDVTRVIAVPLPAGRAFPDVPDGETSLVAAAPALAGVTSLERDYAVPGNDPSTYVFLKSDDQRNLFRVPVPAK